MNSKAKYDKSTYVKYIWSGGLHNFSPHTFWQVKAYILDLSRPDPTKAITAGNIGEHTCQGAPMRQGLAKDLATRWTKPERLWVRKVVSTWACFFRPKYETLFDAFLSSTMFLKTKVIVSSLFKGRMTSHYEGFQRLTKTQKNDGPIP